MKEEKVKNYGSLYREEGTGLTSADIAKTAEMVSFGIKHREQSLDSSEFYAKVKTAEGKNLFLCRKCSYESGTLFQMRRHVSLKHTEREPLRCSMCTHTSNLKENMRKHYMTKHGLTGDIATMAVNRLCSSQTM